MAQLPTVHLLSTGGTIAGVADSSTNLTDYRASALLGSELIAAVPERRWTIARGSTTIGPPGPPRHENSP